MDEWLILHLWPDLALFDLLDGRRPLGHLRTLLLRLHLKWIHPKLVDQDGLPTQQPLPRLGRLL